MNKLDKVAHHKDVKKGKTIPSLKIKLVVMLINIIGNQKVLINSLVTNSIFTAACNRELGK